MHWVLKISVLMFQVFLHEFFSSSERWYDRTKESSFSNFAWQSRSNSTNRKQHPSVLGWNTAPLTALAAYIKQVWAFKGKQSKRAARCDLLKKTSRAMAECPPHYIEAGAEDEPSPLCSGCKHTQENEHHPSLLFHY